MEWLSVRSGTSEFWTLFEDYLDRCHKVGVFKMETNVHQKT